MPCRERPPRNTWSKVISGLVGATSFASCEASWSERVTRIEFARAAWQGFSLSLVSDGARPIASRYCTLSDTAGWSNPLRRTARIVQTTLRGEQRFERGAPLTPILALNH